MQDSRNDWPSHLPERLEEVVAKVPGWTPLDQLCALHALAVTTADLPGDIIEIGSWCGRSSVALAMGTRLAGRGLVHCIDLFPRKDDWWTNPDGSYSFKVKVDDRVRAAYTDQTVWKEPFERDIRPLYERADGILEIFERAIHDFGVVDLVRACKGDMDRFVATAPEGLKCRLAFIDGDHGYEAVRHDIELIENYLVEGGWIAFDDAFTVYDGVNRAITEKIVDSECYDSCHRVTRKMFVARRRRCRKDGA